MTATIAEQAFDLNLESILDDEATCSMTGCSAPAAFYLRYSCGHKGLVCALCAERVRAAFARCVTTSDRVICVNDNRIITDFTVRPI